MQFRREHIRQVECPKCGAEPGVRCLHKGKRARKYNLEGRSHQERVDNYREMLAVGRIDASELNCANKFVDSKSALSDVACRKVGAPICPKCGRYAFVLDTVYGLRNECCGLWSWGAKTPLVDEATHKARIKAHEAFDPLWKVGGLERAEAYRRLSEKLDLTVRQCHMKIMSRETAERVPAAVRDIWTDLDRERNPFHV